MKISYINGVCVHHDAISNAIRDELGFLNDAGYRDVHLYTHACDYSDLPHSCVERTSSIALSPHFQASDIVVKHIKGLDPEVAFQEIEIVNALVATPETRANGLGTIDANAMAKSVDLIASGIGATGKVAAKDVYDAGALPQPPVKP